MMKMMIKPTGFEMVNIRNATVLMLVLIISSLSARADLAEDLASAANQIAQDRALASELSGVQSNLTAAEKEELQNITYEASGSVNPSVRPSRENLSVEAAEFSGLMGLEASPDMMNTTPVKTDRYKASGNDFSTTQIFSIEIDTTIPVNNGRNYSIITTRLEPLTIRLCDEVFIGGLCLPPDLEAEEPFKEWSDELPIIFGQQGGIVGSALNNEWSAKGVSCAGVVCTLEMTMTYRLGAGDDSLPGSQASSDKGLEAMKASPAGVMMMDIQGGDEYKAYIGEKDLSGNVSVRGELQDMVDFANDGRDEPQEEDEIFNTILGEQESADDDGAGFAEFAAQASAAETMLENMTIDDEGNITIFGGEPSACKTISDGMRLVLQTASLANPVLMAMTHDGMNCCRTNPEDVQMGANFAYCENDHNAADWMDARDLAAARMAKRAIKVAGDTRLRKSLCVELQTGMFSMSNPILAKQMSAFPAGYDGGVGAWYLQQMVANGQAFNEPKICGFDDAGFTTSAKLTAYATTPTLWAMSESNITRYGATILTSATLGKKIYFGSQDTYCVFNSLLAKLIQEQGRAQVNELATKSATGAVTRAINFPYFSDGERHLGNVDTANDGVLTDDLTNTVVETTDEVTAGEKISFTFNQNFLGSKNEWTQIQDFPNDDYKIIVGSGHGSTTSSSPNSGEIWVGYCPKNGDCRQPKEIEIESGIPLVMDYNIPGTLSADQVANAVRQSLGIGIEYVIVKTLNHSGGYSRGQANLRGSIDFAKNGIQIPSAYRGGVESAVPYIFTQVFSSTFSVGTINASFSVTGCYVSGSSGSTTYWDCNYTLSPSGLSYYGIGWSTRNSYKEGDGSVTIRSNYSWQLRQDNYDWRFVRLGNSVTAGAGGSATIFEGLNPKTIVGEMKAIASCENKSCEVQVYKDQGVAGGTVTVDPNIYHTTQNPGVVPNDTGVMSAHWLPFNMVNGSKVTFWQWANACAGDSEQSRKIVGESVGGSAQCPTRNELYVAYCSHATKCDFSALPDSPYKVPDRASDWHIEMLQIDMPGELVALNRYVVLQGGCEAGECEWKASGLSIGVGGQLHSRLKMDWLIKKYGVQGVGMWDTEQIMSRDKFNVVPFVYPPTVANPVPKLKYCIGNPMFGCPTDNVDIATDPRWKEFTLQNPLQLNGVIISTDSPKIEIQGGECNYTGCHYVADIWLKIEAMPWINRIDNKTEKFKFVDTSILGVSITMSSEPFTHYQEVYPNCSGFTPDQFMSIDLSKIDLSEFVETLSQEAADRFLTSWDVEGGGEE